MVRVENLDQMLQAYQQAKDACIEVMIQEFIPGDETQGVNYNSYFWNGQPLVEFTAQKVRLTVRDFGLPRMVISKDISEIIEPGRKIIRALGFNGYSCTEFKKDIRDGVYKLMEVNGRHNRSGLLSTHCNINFPWIQYKHLVQGELPSEGNYLTDIYWMDEFNDVICSIKYHHQERYSLMQYIRPYLKRHIFAVFDMKDPMPFFKGFADIIKLKLRKIIAVIN